MSNLAAPPLGGGPRIGTNGTEAAWALGAVAAALALSTLEPRSALALVVAAAVFLIGLHRLDGALGVLIATVPMQDSWPAMLGSTSTTWTRVTLASVSAAWLVRLMLGRDRLVITRVAWWLVAYCAALVVSIVAARDLGAWAEETYRWGVALVVLLIAASVAAGRWSVWPLLTGCAAGVGLSAAVAGYQVWTGTGPASFAQRGVLRAYALFGEPNPLAAYLELAVLPMLAVGLAVVAGRPFFRWPGFGTFMLLAAALGTGTLALTQSRGGALGFAAGLGAIAWLRWPRWGKGAVAVGTVLALVLVWTPPAAPLRGLFGLDAIGRGPVPVTTANFAAQERLAHWGAAWRMWLDNPIFGVGAGNFGERYREYTPVWRFRISRGHAHSAYLQAAAQAGTIGLVCFGGTLVAGVGQCLRGASSASGAKRGLAVGGAAVTAAIAVHGLFDYVHVLSLGIVLSVLWGFSHDDRVRSMGAAVDDGHRRATARKDRINGSRHRRRRPSAERTEVDHPR